MRNMTAGDVVLALREQNLQVATGQIGQSPIVPGQQTQVTLSTLGRLVDAEQFDKIIVKTTPDGRMVRIRDVGWVELGAKNQDMSSEIGNVDEKGDEPYPVANLAIFQLPDANALETADSSRPRSRSSRKTSPRASTT